MPNNITRAKDKSKNERDDTLKEWCFFEHCKVHTWLFTL